MTFALDGGKTIFPKIHTEGRILIVDDQLLHCVYIEKILQQAGFKEIKTVMEFDSLFDTIHQFNPHVIILDLILPAVDGLSLIRQIRSKAETAGVPVLAVTSDHTPQTRLKAFEAGAHDLLHKPFESKELVLKINNMIQQRLMQLRIEEQAAELQYLIEQRTAVLQSTQRELTHRLAQAAEFRDVETGEHVQRIAHFCRLIGVKMGLPQKDCDLLFEAAPLHDVGKIGIPDAILLKPGRLTPDEFEIMKTHTTIGARLLSRSVSEVLQIGEVIALTHHEKWDGSGYPQGLAGEAIPLFGRICAICDVFDALTSARPYKMAWSCEDAVEEIRKQKGRHFDPRIVDVFERVIPEFIRIKTTLKDTDANH